jgi:hypothetical protein
MTPEPKPSARLLVFFHCVFLAMFLVFGIGILRDGIWAIRDKTYTLKYTETTSLGYDGQGASWATDKAAEYRGRDAVVFGIGFAAIGILLLSWATGLVLSLLGRAGLRAPMGVLRGVGFASLAAMAAACLALFPPWRIHTLPLYLVVAAFTLAVTLPIPARWRKKVFPAMVGLVIVVGMNGFPAFPIFAGIFVFLAAGTNVLFLWPGLVPSITSMQRKGRTRHPPKS